MDPPLLLPGAPASTSACRAASCSEVRDIAPHRLDVALAGDGDVGGHAGRSPGGEALDLVPRPGDDRTDEAGTFLEPVGVEEDAEAPAGVERA